MPQPRCLRRRPVTVGVAGLLPAAAEILAGTVNAQAPREPRLVLTEGQVWDFAEELLRQGEYYRAISEYQRLLYFFPQGERTQDARLRIGLAHVLGGEPGQAVR